MTEAVIIMDSFLYDNGHCHERVKWKFKVKLCSHKLQSRTKGNRAKFDWDRNFNI